MKKDIREKINNIGILCVLFISIVTFSSCSKGPVALDENAVPENPVISQPSDTNRPTVSSVTPSDASTSVSISSSNISAVFSEAMDSASINSNNFILATQAGAPVAGIVTYDSANKKAIFSPSANLLYSTVYRATIKTGVKDIAKNALAAEKNWAFTTAAAPAAQDTTPPAILSVYPANGAMSVLVGSSIMGEFSEDMDGSTITAGNFTLVSPGSNIEGTVTYEGDEMGGAMSKVAIFSPKSELSYLTQYVATIKTGVKDLAGNQMQSVKSWVFTTEPEPVPVVPPNSDTTAPTVLRVTPLDGASGVSISAPNILAVFSENMERDTINTSSFTLEGPLGASISGTFVYDYFTTTAQFIPSSSLSYSTVYTVKIKTSVKDSAGNAMVAQKTWSFTTIAAPDVTAPTVIAVTPLSGATGVSTATPNITATFSESMESLSAIGSITLTSPGGLVSSLFKSYDSANKKVEFTPLSNLLGLTTYTVTIAATAKDTSDNNLAAPYTWSFVTGASTGVFTLSSEAFVTGGNIPLQYSSVTGGSNTSIPLNWSNAPSGTQSLVLVIIDTSTSPANYLHWVVKNIPANVTGLAAGASASGMPQGSVQLESNGGAAYLGPAPPRGVEHTYWIVLYALNVSSVAPTSAYVYDDFMTIVGPNIINAVQLEGKFTW